MLFDPKWQQPETKADPLELSTLIAWLEKQPKNKIYRVAHSRSCLLGQYFQAMGFEDYTAKSSRLGVPYTQFGRVAGIGSRAWSTYGEALERARGLAAQQS